MKYRDHKGSFEKSMRTAQDFETVEHLKDHIESVHGRSVRQLTCDHTGVDPRNGWDTYSVLVKFQDSLGSAYVGQSNAKFITTTWRATN